MSLQCAVCTLALATVRAESSCGAARCLLPLHLRCIATPRPTLHWSASPPASAMAGPSSTAKLVPAKNKS